MTSDSQSESRGVVSSTEWLGDIGQPNTTPLPGNVAWEHPRVEAACEELHKAATHLAKERAKFPKESSFTEWSEACNRLENAAIAFGNAVREYTVA